MRADGHLTKASVAAVVLPAAASQLWFVTLPPFLPTIAEAIGVSTALAGQIVGLPVLLAAVLILGVGPLIDAYGHARVMTVALVAIAVSSLGTAVATGAGVLLAARLVGAFGRAGVIPAAFVDAVERPSQEQRRHGTSWVVAGAAAAPLLGVPLLTQVGRAGRLACGVCLDRRPGRARCHAGVATASRASVGLGASVPANAAQFPAAAVPSRPSRRCCSPRWWGTPACGRSHLPRGALSEPAGAWAPGCRLGPHRLRARPARRVTGGAGPPRRPGLASPAGRLSCGDRRAAGPRVPHAHRSDRPGGAALRVVGCLGVCKHPSCR